LLVDGLSEDRRVERSENLRAGYLPITTVFLLITKINPYQINLPFVRQRKVGTG